MLSVQRLFDTQIGAAQCVARNLGTTVNKLVKGKGETHCLDYCNRFRVILDVYGHGREGPGDFESWRQLSTDKFAKETFEREPATELLAFLAKYGPFRVVFLQALAVRDPRIRCPRSNFSRSKVRSSPCIEIVGGPTHSSEEGCRQHRPHNLDPELRPQRFTSQRPHFVAPST